MIKLLLVIFLSNGQVEVALSKVAFDHPGQCEQFLESRDANDIGVFLANLDDKFNQHVHVALSCVEVDKKGQVVPDV